MDNLKKSATGFTASYQGEDTDVQYGFTKLELAALMIAQGICAETCDRGHSYIATTAVQIAKSVLEECNK